MKLDQSWKMIAAGLAACLIAGEAGAAPPREAKEYLDDLDRARGHIAAGLEYQLEVKCEGPDLKPLRRLYKIRSQADNALAEIVEPPEHMGDKVLVNGRKAWQLLHSSQRPIAVMPGDRMSGGLAAVGDIVSSGFSDLYAGKVGGLETRAGRSVLRIDLSAQTPDATYASARYWVDAQSFQGTEIEFSNQAGKALKRAFYTYGNQLKIDGHEQPFLLTTKIVSASSEASFCVVVYGKPTVTAIASGEFELGSLQKKKLP